MPFQITIDAVPQQTFTLLQDDVSYEVMITETRGVMSISFSLDQVVAISNSRVFTDSFLIPYRYLEGDGGNFIITSEADEIPYYTEFGITQFLFYLTAAEMADAR